MHSRGRQCARCSDPRWLVSGNQIRHCGVGDNKRCVLAIVPAPAIVPHDDDDEECVKRIHASPFAAVYARGLPELG